MFYYLVFTLILTGLYGEEVERMVVPQGQPFSFECQNDESVFFGKQLDKWSELQENDLNLNFQYSMQNNILRVTSEAAQPDQVGYYACRKPTWTSTSMNIIYQLILAEIHSFYWNYICHAPLGSCERADDLVDDSRSSLTVADQTDAELFCCASTTGYQKVDIQMNQVGNSPASIELKRRQEPDGSSVICAHQRTRFQSTPYQQRETFTCELLVDTRRHSMLSSVIFFRDAVLPPPQPPPPRYNTPPWNYNPYVANNQDMTFFQRRNGALSRRKLTTGAKIAIILGSILGGILLVGVIVGLLCCLCGRKRKSPSRTTTTLMDSNQYLAIRNPEQRKQKKLKPIPDDYHVYEEPTV